MGRRTWYERSKRSGIENVRAVLPGHALGEGEIVLESQDVFDPAVIGRSFDAELYEPFHEEGVQRVARI